jgi:hypothetical protein
LSKAIEELNLDIKERERKGLQAQENMDGEAFHLEKCTLGQVEMV